MFFDLHEGPESVPAAKTPPTKVNVTDFREVQQ